MDVESVHERKVSKSFPRLSIATTGFAVASRSPLPRTPSGMGGKGIPLLRRRKGWRELPRLSVDVPKFSGKSILSFSDDLYSRIPTPLQMKRSGLLIDLSPKYVSENDNSVKRAEDPYTVMLSPDIDEVLRGSCQ
mmetsp:Transcript_30897/g.43063  ORF Transcript_30897/g.43063 Transcript_30897/m.43063 type:complete len:135 (-) Transcript_30897:262-666(-)|eukprot:CAMPEP_0185264776 /NCGR_PEP_ID=MMETSP1359-20130426/24745_1 /TAXON_ID=552665 /ORGANISM="Bigelowiella longifila, Strain CCMP242" /LENGTH=134 /DNA_ID=CAMNT_0027853577 /DNA_START=124 /DNA_END=528 /DNA_ORIENTATION=+